MNYNETLQYLYSQLPMFQRQGAVAYKNNLDNTLLLDNYFENPHQSFKTIHVAGTNGKGSVSHMLSSILQCAGYQVGLYTSPHLKDFRERIRINGEMISEQEVVDFVEDFLSMKKQIEIEPSFFELTVSMAFCHFKKRKVNIAVIEVGLGGRLDSTNVITPELSIITNISFDHTVLLGNTLALIAGEKAGIIKPNIPVIIGTVTPETQPVFQAKSELMNAPMILASTLFQLKSTTEDQFNIESEGTVILNQIKPELKGIYQLENLATVYATVTELQKKGFQIPDEAIREGIQTVMKRTGLMGRWQKLGNSPLIICDTGHNEAGIRYVMNQIAQTPYEKLHIVFGVVNDKDVTTILKLLPKQATYYFAKASVDRALNSQTLQSLAAAVGLHGGAFATVPEALNAAKQNATINDLIFVGGSTFVVADVV